MIPFHRNTFGQEEKDAVSLVIDTGMVSAGQEAHAFEEEFSKYVGARYAVYTNSCTNALKIAYMWAKENLVIPSVPTALGKINPERVRGIVYSRNTYCATYAPAVELGLEVRATHSGYEDFFTTKEPSGDQYPYSSPGFINVSMHYAGIKDNHRATIEDSAHRIEADDSLVGQIRCYSFHGTKAITTGHGGMFVTNDREIYRYARLANDDGIVRKGNGDKASWDYNIEFISGGCDGSDINAAIGREQLKKLPAFTKRRNDILAMYNAGLGTDWQGNLFYVYFLKDLQEIEDFIAYMTAKGIGTAYHYPKTGWLGVSLPIYPLLTDEQVKKIIKAVKSYETSQSKR